MLGAARGAALAALFSLSAPLLGKGEKGMMCALAVCCGRGAATWVGVSITGVTAFFAFCVSRDALSLGFCVSCARQYQTRRAQRAGLGDVVMWFDNRHARHVPSRRQR